MNPLYLYKQNRCENVTSLRNNTGIKRQHGTEIKRYYMAYNAELADRTREIISVTRKNVEEKAMFGGLCFMVNDKMCVGIVKDSLMVRLNPEIYDEAIEMEGCEPMNFTGKTMKGFVFVENFALSTRQKLEYWINLALEFNSEAKSSKKKKH
jgi:TfoX/Sxy family transcriptional regulator of competence genes